MSERPTLVDIHPQDDENSQDIMTRIRKENITDEAAIRAIVESYQFSSPETKQHTSDRIIDLLRMGTFNSPPPKTIKLDAIDIDAHNL